MEEKILKLRTLINNSKKILFFTGAGISTNSGIPDYRGPNGVWKIKEPVYYDEFLESDEKKIEYWSFKLEAYNYFKNAKPNRAHYAIVELERKGKVIGVVTQNIDGLHLKSGLEPSKIIELHGTNSKAVCLKCKSKIEIEKALEEFKKSGNPPLCNECGGYLKPAVVMFGEPLNQNDLNKAFLWAKECDLCVAVGSTLVVQPACYVCYEAYLNGKPFVIINKGETLYDKIATVKIEDDAEKILSEVMMR